MRIPRVHRLPHCALTDADKARHEARVQAECARIAALGLCGFDRTEGPAESAARGKAESVVVAEYTGGLTVAEGPRNEGKSR